MASHSDETPTAEHHVDRPHPSPAGDRGSQPPSLNGGCACGCAEAANEHVLSEYYGVPPKAPDALADGIEAILKEKGGFLCIPPDPTSECFVPRNFSGHRKATDPCGLYPERTESVTVRDDRRGVERAYLPPAGDLNSELTTFAGRIEERDLAVDLDWQGSYAVHSLCSRLYGGASSFSTLLSRQTDSGKRRFYVPTLMGLFPGQRLKIGLIDPPIFTVEHLGLDAQGPFFETREAAPRDVEQGASVYDKHNVHVLSLSDTSNCDNQGMSIDLHRRAYGAGDVFLFSGILDYQSNIYSGGGDEGGVGCAINLQHDLEAFHGVVESWTPAAGRETEMVYRPTRDALPPLTRNSQKLGTSRPLINLKESRQKRDGTANVFRPGIDPKEWLTNLPSPLHAGGCVLIRPATRPASWQAYLGYFLALTGRTQSPVDDSEHYRDGEATWAGTVTGDVHRWWYVTGVQDAGEGRAYLYVERPVQREDRVVQGGPLLFRDANYTDGQVQIDDRQLGYILAPGAWVSDVRNGVAGNVLGNEGAQPEHPRKILLAPGDPQLHAGDPVTNPPGPDVFHPSGFRARQLHTFPAMNPGSSFLSENYGQVQVGSGLHIAGTVIPEKGETLPDALLRLQKDQLPHYGSGVWITGTCGSGFRIDGYCSRSALELRQVHGHLDITWWDETTSKTSTLRADRKTGDFVLATTHPGGVATVTGPGGVALTELRGISATATPAQNLCGRQEVEEKKTAVTVLLPQAEADPDYRIFLQPSWLTLAVVATRKEALFEVEFGTQAPAGATCDWLLVR